MLWEKGKMKMLNSICENEVKVTKKQIKCICTAPKLGSVSNLGK